MRPLLPWEPPLGVVVGTKAMAEAWARSVDCRDAGIYGVRVVPSAVADCLYYDQDIRFMLDLKRRVVAVWRAPVGRDPHIQFDSPFGMDIDGRMLGYLADADITRGVTIEQKIAELDEENRKAAREREQAAFGKIDHGRILWARDRTLRDLDGKPRGLQSAVPADLTTEG